MHEVILLSHILATTIWTGGHLVLALTVLPRALKHRSLDSLRDFESGFEKIGVPALLIQIVTGVLLAYQFVPKVGEWINLTNPVSRLIFVKLSLLALTALLAIDARFRIIPKLSEKNLSSLAFHIIPVTIISVLFVVVGVSFRTGWFY